MKLLLYSCNSIFKHFLCYDNVKEFDDSKTYDPNETLIVFTHALPLKCLRYIGTGHYLQAASYVHLDQNLLTKHTNYCVIFYNTWEIRPLSHFNLFVQNYLHLPLDRVYFSMSDFKNHMTLRDRIISFDWVFLREKTSFQISNKNPYYSKKKFRIITLNRRCNQERSYYCCYIFSKYPKQTLFSCTASKNLIPDTVLSRTHINNFKKILPVTLDKDFDISGVATITPFLMMAFIHVIFETNAHPLDSEIQQISEKSYKGIKTGQPFIIFQKRGGILKHLHKLGFKTFHPHINETYDDETLTYEERFNRLLAETTRICTMPENEIKKIYSKMETIVNHNLQILQKSQPPNVFDTFIT